MSRCLKRFFKPSNRDVLELITHLISRYFEVILVEIMWPYTVGKVQEISVINKSSV